MRSPADIDMTREIVHAAAARGIAVHVIESSSTAKPTEEMGQ